MECGVRLNDEKKDSNTNTHTHFHTFSCTLLNKNEAEQNIEMAQSRVNEFLSSIRANKHTHTGQKQTKPLQTFRMRFTVKFY